MEFFLGTHQVDWLGKSSVPLFVSARRLRQRVRLPVATCDWALDSGGFSELSMYGEWQTPAFVYAREAETWQVKIGRMRWAAIQDWMCEPFILEKTGLTVLQHQARTVASLRDLRALAPGVPWTPVLQGWERQDYLRHVEMYSAAGFDLLKEPVVGIGSVCRRQATDMAEELIRDLAATGIRLHGFGFKVKGLARVHDCLVSADSMAWSIHARRADPLPGCPHKSCANCQKYALKWRAGLLATVGRAV